MEPLAGVIALLKQFGLYTGLIILGIVLDPTRWIGGVSWTLLTLLLAYRFTLWLAGPHTLPIAQDKESRNHARAVLKSFARGGEPSMAIVQNGKVLLDAKGESRARTEGPGMIFIDGTSVVALFTDLGLSRIKGRGVHFLRKDERIGIVINLRSQSRSEVVEAQTRDGIWVKIKVSVNFKIEGTVAQRVQDVDQSSAPWPDPYIWSSRQIKRVLQSERVGAEQKVKWDELALAEASKRLHTLIAEYTFDKLTEPHDPRTNPIDDIREQLEEEVKVAMGVSGIKVLAVGLGQVAPRDEEIDHQRIESWRAELQSRMRVITAQGQAQSIKELEMAKASGQLELVTRIAQAIEESREKSTGDDLALNLVRAVENLAAQPYVGRQLPRESKETLRRMRVLAEEGFFDHPDDEIVEDLLNQSGKSEPDETPFAS